METNCTSPDPKPKDRKQNPTNQDQGVATAEVTDSPDLNGERPAPSSQDSGKRQQGADDDTADKSEVTGKQVDDYFGDSGDSSSNDQLN